MKPIGDVKEASSSRSEEERAFKEELNDSAASPMKNRLDDSVLQPVSEREEETTINTNYDSDSSSSKNTTRSNPIQYTDQPKEDSDQLPMGFYGHGPAYYNPFPFGIYPSKSHVPAPYGYPMQSRPQNWMLPRPPFDPDILDTQLQDPRFFPATQSRYGDVTYSPVFHHGHFSPRGGVQDTRWPSETDVQKAVSDTKTRRCHPLAGGSPFIACHNCFELLYLPRKKLLAPQEKQQNLQCGACSEVMSFAIVEKKLLLSSPPALSETTNQVVSVEVEDRSARTAVVDDCPLKDVEQRIHRETRIVQSLSPEYSNVNRAEHTYGIAQLGYNNQESYMKQDSLKPESVATKTDFSYDDNTEVSEDSKISKTSSKEESRPKTSSSKENEYGSSEVKSEIISNEQNVEKLEVWVNGHLIPEDLVISAEKLAGPLQSGKYWYDYRAGFWGVMGNPCLGMIPPFIEEFNRPMPYKCGAGNTSVFVNGRELHERDLELLSGRGLPRDKNRSYIIDISGRVLDGDSGEELKSLGKLAPTIDKVRRGFGMKVPRSLVS